MSSLGWLYTENLPQFLEFSAGLLNYEFSRGEIDAYVKLVSEADAERDNWVRIALSDTTRLVLFIAPDVGTSVTHVRAAGDNNLVQQLSGVCAFLAMYTTSNRV